MIDREIERIEMIDRELELERIEVYCDADRRGRIDPEQVEEHCPTLEEAMISREIG